MGMWRRFLAVMKYQWQRQENSIHGVSTSISFTTLGTDGGFPQYLGTPRTTSIRFLRSWCPPRIKLKRWGCGPGGLRVVTYVTACPVTTSVPRPENGEIIPGSQVSVPGKWPDEITVIVEFSESEGKARVTVTEVDIPLIAYPMMKIGWAQQFDKIQLLL